VSGPAQAVEPVVSGEGTRVPDPPAEVSGRTVLAFLNEVAGGRRLLETLRDRHERGAARIALVAPQNQPAAGQIVDLDELYDAAQARVEVTQGLLKEFGIESVGSVMDADPSLALDDAARAYQPAEVILSCLAETRFGLLRRDLVTWAQANVEAPITHIPVRIEDDAIRWDVTHTLVVATKTVDSPELLENLKDRAGDKPHRYTFICPRSGDLTRSDVSARLARALAEIYRHDIDGTGQPMSPEPFAAVRNAIEHYRVDDILISTLAGEQSVWLKEGLIDRVKEITEKPIDHIEAHAREEVGDDASAAVATTVSEGREESHL
jgi:hypothetical protein